MGRRIWSSDRRYQGYGGSDATPMELGMMQGNPRGSSNRGGRGPARGGGARGGGGGRGAGRGSDNRGRLPREDQDMDPAAIQRHMDQGLCFRCHQRRHYTRDCPRRGR